MLEGLDQLLQVSKFFPELCDIIGMRCRQRTKEYDQGA